MTPKEKRALWRTAIHEAGHVTMILAHELKFRRVTVKPMDDYLGAVTRTLSKRLVLTIQSGDALAVSRAVEPLVLVSLAGGVAVGIHCGQRGRWRGAEGDFQNVADYMLHAYGTDCRELQAHLRYLRLKTEALLSRPGARWQTKTIAKALIARRVLSHKEVDEALQAAAAAL